MAAGLAGTAANAQTQTAPTPIAHSHNDYHNNIPFYRAYHKEFGSIEADIFPVKGDLYVAHDKDKITKGNTLSKLYLEPVLAELQKDQNRQLNLLIDIKENHQAALPILVKQLKPLRHLLRTTTKQGQLTIIISGNRPQPADYQRYPDFIFFDDHFRVQHTHEQWQRVALVSTSFTTYSTWNGKGVLPKKDFARIQGLIDSVHAAGKLVRFWAAPDTKTSWLALMDMGVDVVGTDRVEELGTFLHTQAKSNYQAAAPYAAYKPTYKSDGTTGKVKNIILLIGDGMGLTQAYAAYTANRGQLNLFQMRNLGLSVTTAADAYGTDSAAGGTAMATGQKTANRAVGVDTTGRPLKSLAIHAAESKKKTAIVAACDLTDATPASFYAHQAERSSGGAIAQDLLSSPIDMLVGSGRHHFEAASNGTTVKAQLQQKGYTVTHDMPAFLASDAPKLIALVDDSVTRSVLKGRGNFLSAAFNKVTQRYADDAYGFFLMLEGSQIDWGGHGNNLPQVITENMDFDLVVGEALRFADADGETLVIVTADHETGGLSLLNGDIATGSVTGEFSTDDHTGIPVPVYAYGPHAQNFRGIYQNTEIFHKLLELLNRYKEKLP